MVAEFTALLGAVGLSLPASVDGAIRILGGHISPAAVSRLRRHAGTPAKVIRGVDRATLVTGLAGAVSAGDAALREPEEDGARDRPPRRGHAQARPPSGASTAPETAPIPPPAAALVIAPPCLYV